MHKCATISCDKLTIKDFEKVEGSLIKLQKQKDAVMDTSRNIIRMTGKAITLMHAGDLGTAGKMIADISKHVKKLNEIEKGFEYNSLQAHQEYVEAYAFFHILKNKDIISLDSIKESEIAYLLGIMDLVGELKREAVESLRKNDRNSAELYYKFMIEIYDSSRHMRFAESIAPDFRKKQDVARIQIETTASELLRNR